MLSEFHGLFLPMVAVFIEELLNHVENDGFGCYGFLEGILQKRRSVWALSMLMASL